MTGVDLDGRTAEDQWSIRDIADLVRGHFQVPSNR
jgi:hypothetical protein